MVQEGSPLGDNFVLVTFLFSSRRGSNTPLRDAKHPFCFYACSMIILDAFLDGFLVGFWDPFWDPFGVRGLPKRCHKSMPKSNPQNDGFDTKFVEQ